MNEKYSLFSEAEHYFDGRLVLKILDENKSSYDKLPDIILLDINMPHLSGWGFLKKLNEIYDTLSKPIAIYVVSSSVDPRDWTRAKKYPFVKNFLLKPISKELLQEIQP